MLRQLTKLRVDKNVKLKKILLNGLSKNNIYCRVVKKNEDWEIFQSEKQKRICATN